MTTAQDLLRQFGITGCYRGLKYVVFVVELAVSEEERLEAVTKELYMETASHFNCKWTAVERNIRTVAARAWRVNPDLLCEIAGYPLTCTPTASEFIEIVVSYILRSSQPQP